MADFPASPKPDYPIDVTVPAPEVLISVHRDGSEQRRLKGTGDGATYSLRFGGSCPITQAQLGGFLDHYAGQNGTLSSFHWTHPETEDVLLVRYAEPLMCSLVAYDGYQLQIKLKVVPA